MSGNREPHVSSMRIISAIIAAFTCGVIFYGQREDQDGIENINGAIFFAVLFTTYNSIAGAIYTFPNEFPGLNEKIQKSFVRSGRAQSRILAFF